MNKIFKTLTFLIPTTILFGVVLSFVVYRQLVQGLPEFVSTADYKPLGVTTLYAKNSKGEKEVLAEFFKERRYLLPFEKIPQKFIDAFISAEDEGFFEHGGVSYQGIFRATVINFFSGEALQGASTITQQTARTLFLSAEKSMVRKLKELIITYRMEKNLTKEQILYLYLNQIYLGHGAYGIEAAARSYYRKNADQLTTAEVALLAGLPKAPSKYSPFTNPKRAKERQLYVLRRMVETHTLSDQDRALAASEPLKLYLREDFKETASAYTSEQVRRELIQRFGEQKVYEEGLIVETSARPELIEAAKKAVRVGLRDLEKRHQYRGPQQNLATSDERLKWIQDAKELMITKKNPYMVLMPDERVDGPKTDRKILEIDDFDQAMVERWDSKSKSWQLKMAGEEVWLPETETFWAKEYLAKTPFKPGDIIWTRVIRVEPSKPTVSLEQKPVMQAALYSFDLTTGEVLAMVGGYDFTASEFNRATQAKRQLGSTFKPIIFAAAVEKGYTPSSIIVDAPIVYDDDEKGKWKPSNYEDKFYGDTTFRQALINSRNIPTVKIVESIKVPYLIDFSKRLGWTSELNQDLSISLGSSLTTLDEITKIYSVFPRMGQSIQSHLITKVVDRSGSVIHHVDQPENYSPEFLTGLIEQAKSQPQEEGKIFNPIMLPNEKAPHLVMDPRVAYVMTHLMSEVVQFGTGKRALSLGRPAAGKTGTTSENKDAWFVGFTPNVATGVWVGADDLTSLGSGETGASAALPIWIDFMAKAVEDYPIEDFWVPPGITFAQVHPDTGKPFNGPGAVKEAYISGTEPTDGSTSGGRRQDLDTQSEFLKEDL